MLKESKFDRPHSTQEFVDAMGSHRERLEDAVDQLPPAISDAIEDARRKTRQALSLSPDKFVVIFGEQTYGLNERAKVLGKRLFAKGVEKHGDVQSLELFASYDTIGSEPALYRMQMPHTQSVDGYVSLNILKGWTKRKNTVTAALRSPTEKEMEYLVNQLSGSYRSLRAQSLTKFMRRYYEQHPHNYAQANIEMLREFEKQIGLGIVDYVTENVIDTQIAANGGMEVMLYLWPHLTNEAINNKVLGVRVPDTKEAPFFLYHEDGECNGRMPVKFQNSRQGLHLDSDVYCWCWQCGHHEETTPQEVIEQSRSLTWRAIPRVVMYSTIGVADGHITGGGSLYDKTASATMRELELPFFPISWMKRRGDSGEKENPFIYDSYVTTKGKVKSQRYYQAAKKFVRQGRAAMADLALSIGTDNLRLAIERQLDQEINTSTKIVFGENNQQEKNPKIFSE